MKIINIIDNGCERYTINSDCSCLGRQWDNLSEQIQVVRPLGETNNVCTMIVSADGVVIDHLDIKDEPKDITNALSRYPVVEISFTFTNESGYVKNSEIKGFYFAEARKPEDYVPVEPEQSSKLDIVLGNAFIRAEFEDDILRFYNANGDIAQECPLPTGGTSDYNELNNKPSINGVPLQGNKSTSDLGIVSEETDPTVPNWAKNPNKPTYSYEEITNKPSFANVSRTGSYNDLIDKPNIPSVTGLASETYVNNKIADLVNSAPETLDTLGEVAEAIQENEDVVNALNSAIGNKADKTSVPKITTTLLEDGSYSLSVTTGA